MTAYRVVGIDPALTAVGLAIVESESPGRYQVTRSVTVKPGKAAKPMLDRLAVIREEVDETLWDEVDQSQAIKPFDAIAIEDPTTQIRVRSKRQSPRDIAVMSLAVGVVVGAAQAFLRFLPDHLSDRKNLPALAFIDVDEWMPKQQSGNFSHIMAKPLIIRTLRSQIRIPQAASEHEVMAAGVARYWIEQQRLRQKLRTPA